MAGLIKLIFLVVAFPWPKNKLGSKKFGYCEPETGEKKGKTQILRVLPRLLYIYKQFVILYVLLFSVFGSDGYMFFFSNNSQLPPKNEIYNILLFSYDYV